MSEHNAFERQLADEIEYEVGPPRNVDATEVTRQAKTTSPRWRFRMSSTIKFAAAGTVLAVFGAALLLAVPGGTSPNDGIVAPPGAEDTSAAPSSTSIDGESETPAWFTASIGDSLPSGMPDVSYEVGVEYLRGLEREGPIEATDPRLTGSLVRVLNADTYQVSPTEDVMVQTDLWRIETEQGTWLGESTGLSHFGEIADEAATEIGTVVLTGDGAYEGLSAYLFVDWAPEVGADVQGAIFAGEMPPAPEGSGSSE